MPEQTKCHKVFCQTASHLLIQLRNNPLLLGWLIIGTVIAAVTKGVGGLISATVSIFLIGIYAIIIHIFTEKQTPDPEPVKRPQLETAAGILLYLVMMGMVALGFNLTKIPYLQNSFNHFIQQVYHHAENLAFWGLPQWLLGYLGNALTSIIMLLIPTLALFLAFGYSWRRMGLKPRFWKLTALLLGITLVLGFPLRQVILYEFPIYKTLGIFFIYIFINALPEELFYRGYLLPRFENLLGNSLNALVITSILFNASHIPADIYQGMSISHALLNSFSTYCPTGLIWGYLYLRTRSIIPGVLWHTSNTILGYFLFSI